MKKAFYISAVLGFTLLSACGAKDTFIPRAGDRATSFGGQATNGQFESNKHLMLLIDRQVEAIFLFKAVTDPDFATKNNIKVEDILVNKETLKKLTSGQQKFKDGPQEQTSQFSLLASIEQESDALTAVTITANSEELTQEKVVVSGTDLVLKSKLKEITIVQTDEANIYDATIKMIDEINVKSGKSIALNESKFKFSLIGNEAKILTIELLQHNRYGIQNGDMAMKSSASSVVIQFAECASVSGTLNLESLSRNAKGPTYVRTAAYNDSSVSLVAGKDTLVAAANACAARPIVDLKKLF